MIILVNSKSTFQHYLMNKRRRHILRLGQGRISMTVNFLIAVKKGNSLNSMPHFTSLALTCTPTVAVLPFSIVYLSGDLIFVESRQRTCSLSRKGGLQRRPSSHPESIWLQYRVYPRPTRHRSIVVLWS